MSVKRKKNKIKNKKQNLFLIKYLFLLFISILISLFSSLIIIKNFHFQHEQFKTEEIKRYNEKINNLKAIKSIIEDYKAKKEAIKKINIGRVVFNEYNDKYFFYYDNKDTILKRNHFKENFKIKKFNTQNNFQKILDHATDKISHELKQLKKILFSKEININKEILNDNKEKINAITNETKKIEECIKKISDNNLEVIILPKIFLFFA